MPCSYKGNSSNSQNATSNRKRRMLRFDPRLPNHRFIAPASIHEAVKSLNSVVPFNSIMHLWGIGPEPPQVVQEIEVTTTLSLHDSALALVFSAASVTEHTLQNPLTPQLAAFIEDETKLQSQSLLWQLLHKGRLTSSLFGEIYKSKQPTSLIDRILNNRSVLNRMQ